MAERAEVVVIGGGCMGASIAYHLACRGVQGVRLLERHALASGQTGHSTALIRQHYSQALLVRMALHGLRTYSSFEHAVGTASGFIRTGFLVGVSHADRGALERNVAVGQSLGAVMELLEPQDVDDLDPRISTEDLGALCYEPEAGYCDPYLATAGFAAAARRAGAHIEEGVAALALARGRVETSAGTLAAAGVVVAAGPWSAGLLAPLGYELPVRAVRSQVGRFRVPPGFDPPPPTVADFAGLIYLKPAEPGYLDVGSLDPREAETSVDPDLCPPGAELATLAGFRQALVRRIPELAAGHWRGSWSGAYDVTPDWHPAIGRVPGAEDVYVAAGFSGHGFKLAPAVGMAVAELLCEGRFQTLDLAPLDPGRFERGELLGAQYGYSVAA